MVVLLAAVVTATSGAPRILLAAGQLPEALRPFVWSDALFTYQRGLTGHRLPYVDTPFEYPPLIGIISGLLSVVASGPVPYVLGWSLLLVAAAAACAAVLVRSAGPRGTLLFWSLSPQLLLLGALNFDVLPALMLVVATVAARRGHDVASAVALAAGFAAKFFPLASAPLALLRARRRRRFALAFALVLLAVYVPTAPQPHTSVADVGFYAVGISANIDSVWGILERLFVATGVPSPRILILALTLSGLAASYVLLVVPRALRARDPAVGFLLATVALLFWSRLYSPQYSLWLVPFFALLPLGARVFAVLTIADVGIFLTIYPLTLVRRELDDPMSLALLGALAGFVVLRHAALVLVWRRASALVDGPR